MEKYHYCSADAFLSIITKKQLWLSDLKFVNDPLEMELAPEIIDSAVKDFFKRSYQELLSEIPKSQETFFSLSLTSCDDLLSQWIAYAKNGSGFQLGFNVDELLEINQISGHSVFKVNQVFYKKDDYLNFLRCEFEKNFNDMDRRDFQGRVRINPTKFSFIDSIRTLKCLLKSNFYEEEEEFRFFYYLNHLFVEKYKHFDGYEIKPPLPQYVVKNEKIVSYVPIKFSDVNRGLCALKSIRLGPNNKSSVEDIKLLLGLNGFESVSVENSKGSFREKLS